MKKRLLALALCLVMMTSLLPLTALAYTPEEVNSWFDGIKDGGIYCGDKSFDLLESPDAFYYRVVGTSVHRFLTPSTSSHTYTLNAGLGNIELIVEFTEDDYGVLHVCINSDHAWDSWESNDDGTHSRSCSNGCGTLKTEPPVPCVDANQDHECDVCYGSVHTWSYEISKAGDSLKATCDGQGCDFQKVNVTISAQSVTLPTSPFNATVETSENFKEVFSYGDIHYRYKDPTAGWTDIDDPKTFTPKPGEYQAGVWIYGLPGNGGVATRAVGNDDGTNQGGSVYLFVKYTAADPKVTAQTGDNRPIEIMMASVLVFSALAAAAFILDSKRKYSR